MNKKRVIFCTFPSIYSSLVLKKLLADDEIELVAIISSNRVLCQRYSVISAFLKQIQISGWRYSFYLFLVTDVFAFLSTIFSVFSKKNQLKTINAYAKEHSIPIVKTPDINQQSVVDFITNKNPDYLLAAHFNQLVKAPVFDIDGLSFLNIHPSLLPAYKGVDPVFYALVNREEKIGVSLHEMAETFDTGVIRAQKEFLSKQFDSVFLHNCQLFESGAELAITVIKSKMFKGNIQGEGNYDSWPTPQLLSKLKSRGYWLIRLNELFSKIQRG